MLPELLKVRVATIGGKDVTLGEVAFHDRRLFYSLCYQAGIVDPMSGQLAGQVGQVPVVESPVFRFTGGWELINVAATWTSTAANQNVPGELSGLVETDLWVRSVKYTVQRPNAFAGSILKAQSDQNNKLNPNINVQLTINSYCQYLISPDYTPLENVVETFFCECPVGLVLSCGASIQAAFTNLRALATDENPTIATITLSGTRLPPGVYGGCRYADILLAMRQFGLAPAPTCP